MKNILTIILIALLPALVFSQENNVRSYKAPCEKIKAFTMGSGKTTNGEFVYSFSSKPKTEYNVVITPSKQYSNLYVTSKNEDGFVIKADDGADVYFDFVVFVRLEAPNLKE